MRVGIGCTLFGPSLPEETFQPHDVMYMSWMPQPNTTDMDLQRWSCRCYFRPPVFWCVVILTAALLRVTADHRLYIWGHPSNRKLGHVGFNHDGTEATGGQGPGGQGRCCRMHPEGSGRVLPQQYTVVEVGIRLHKDFKGRVST